ncbi:MAG: type II toxin-antitoxin system VapC family toxin [Deltaproteobacteria bacterium]|nr:type II toxin-antitoxin system VapC family toxin [Deltaproteobacteria bacterium]
MKIGIDSCILVAGVHANHPLHAVSANWLIRNIPLHKLIVTHHSILEAYAVLTRLPGKFRIDGIEARQLLESTIRTNITIAKFDAASIWDYITALVTQASTGGHSYDAFIAEILINNAIDAIATFNTKHFIRFTPQISIIDPSSPMEP